MFCCRARVWVCVCARGRLCSKGEKMFFLPELVTKWQVTHNLPLAEQPMRSCSLFGELAWETGGEL